jgi:hypothetical protein
MQLERLSVELRRRNSWETLDLGLAMLQIWRVPVLRAWCITYWPFALLVGAFTWTEPWLGALIVWWSKPLFDRVLLHVYSNAVFGGLPSVKDVWRALPRLLRNTRLIAGLTFYRLSAARSFFLPVWQLEGQRGKAAAARRRTLGRRGYGCAAWLTFVCANLVGVLVISGVILVLVMLPVGSGESLSLSDFFTPSSESPALSRCLNLLTFAADTLVEPYFVAAGFSLYLNRRSELEGWDIEVAFRQMDRNRSAGPALVARALCVASVVIGVALASLSFPVSGAENTDVATPASTSSEQEAPKVNVYPAGEIKRRLATVLDDPVFGRKETQWRWVYRQKADDSESPAWWRALMKWLERFSEDAARVVRVLVWISGATLLAVAIYLIVRHRERWWRQRSRHQPPEMLFGLDVRRESLPEDVRAAASELLARDPVAALSLLYRGALSALIHTGGVEFRPGDTERECWQRARSAMSDVGLGYFRRLLDAWLWAAYGRRLPPQRELDHLCEAWPQYFGGAAFTPGTAP